MSSSFRLRRPNQSPLNTPVASRVISSTPLTADQAQVQLDSFITELENVAHGFDGFNPAESSEDMIISNQSRYTGIDSSILNQLKRVQRDLRGLPPLLTEASSNSGSRPASAAPTNTVNKKIVFGDDSSSAPKPNKKIVFEEISSIPEEPELAEEPVVVEIQTKTTEVVEESKTEGGSGIDKEERKRLKKERRKEEKRQKLEQASY